MPGPTPWPRRAGWRRAARNAWWWIRKRAGRASAGRANWPACSGQSAWRWSRSWGGRWPTRGGEQAGHRLGQVRPGDPRRDQRGDERPARLPGPERGDRVPKDEGPGPARRLDRPRGPAGDLRLRRYGFGDSGGEAPLQGGRQGTAGDRILKTAGTARGVRT